ncbi:MAG: hypothetical protein LBP25_00460 [Tannerellaceae bacterium]|jgi:hypothetical protein|nr:hypothetical protein [Tannerellaceae bacterium]
MKTSKFTISNVLSTSWNALKSQIWILAGLFIGYFLFFFTLGAILAPVSNSILGGLLVNLLITVLSLMFMLGYLKNLFQVLDGDEPRFSAYGQQARKILTIFVSSILCNLVVFLAAAIFLGPYFFFLLRYTFVGYLFPTLSFMHAQSDIAPDGNAVIALAMLLAALCLSLPSIYFSIRFMFYQAFIVDEDAGIIESLQKSWQITKGQTLPLFLLGIVALGLILAGAFACGIGIFIAVPLIYLMFCCVFRKLNN